MKGPFAPARSINPRGPHILHLAKVLRDMLTTNFVVSNILEDVVLVVTHNLLERIT